MKKLVIETVLGILAAISLCCICSDPNESAPVLHWVLWELAWIAVLIIDVRVIIYCVEKGIIDMGEDEQV